MEEIQPLDAYALVRRKLVTLRMATRAMPVTEESVAIESVCAETICLLDAAIASELRALAPDESIACPGPSDTVN